MGRVRTCLGRVGCLVLLVLGVTFGWLYRTEIQRWWLERTAEAPAVAGSGSGAAGSPAEDDGGRFEMATGAEARGSTSAEAAGEADAAGDGTAGDAAERDAEGAGSVATASAVERFLAAPPPVSVRLDREELAALLERRVEPGLPDGIARPSAVPDDSTMSVAADVDIRRTLGDRLPAMLRRMVGDSARIQARVVPSVPRHGVLRLRVREARAGSVGLPVAAFPWILSELGLPLAPDDPTAVDLPVGADLAEARVEAGELVLVRRAAARAIQ